MKGIFKRRKYFDIMGLRVIMKGKEIFPFTSRSPEYRERILLHG